MQSFLETLKQTVHGRHLLNHSFYQRWQMGQLSLEELKGYAKEYYAFEKEFPRFLSSMHSRTDNRELRKSLLENLMHEEHGPENHPELWLQFAEGLGVARENVETHIHSDETEHLLRTFRKLCFQGSLEEGLAALFAYEFQQPAVASKKIEGLEAFYNVRKESTVAFFKAHEHYDVEHADTEAEWLSQLCDDDLKKQRALAAADTVTKALYDFLDGVERRYRQAA